MSETKLEFDDDEYDDAMMGAYDPSIQDDLDPWYNITWAQIMASPFVDQVEHPLLGGVLPKSIIHDELGAALDKLDGTKPMDVVDTFFYRDYLNPSILRFVDDDARNDIYDLAVAERCIPVLDSTHSRQMSSDTFCVFDMGGGGAGGDGRVGEDYEPDLTFEEQLDQERAQFEARQRQRKKKLTFKPKTKTLFKQQLDAQIHTVDMLRNSLEMIRNEHVLAFQKVELAKAETALQQLLTR